MRTSPPAQMQRPEIVNPGTHREEGKLRTQAAIRRASSLFKETRLILLEANRATIEARDKMGNTVQIAII